MKITYLILSISLCLALCSCSSSIQSPSPLKPEIIISPVSVHGEVTEARRRFLENTLNETLSLKFRIIPQKRFEAAQESAFQEMDYEQCTEDQCFMLIQEKLQVQYLFHLEVIAEGFLTQLSLKLIDLDEKKTVNDSCEKCTTLELSERVRKLTIRLLRERNIFEAGELDEDLPEIRREDEPKPDSDFENQKSSKSEKKWNLRIRGIYGEYSKDDMNIKNVSYALSWKGFGLGTSNFQQTMKSASGNQYSVEANFLDSFITIGEQFNATAGFGWATSGKAQIESSSQTYQSGEIYGLKYYGLLGYQWGAFESMLGYQYIQLRYRRISNIANGLKLENPLYVLGGLFMFGIGMDF